MNELINYEGVCRAAPGFARDFNYQMRIKVFIICKNIVSRGENAYINTKEKSQLTKLTKNFTSSLKIVWQL